MRTCTFVHPETGQCPEKYRARGFCRKHYLRFLRHGDPSITKHLHEGTIWGRLEQKIEEVDHGFHQPCLEFTGSLDSGGYGQMRFEGKNNKTHTVSYEEHHGPIPEGWQVDHMCCNKKCCNPDHLEALPREVNLALGNIPHFKPHYKLVSGLYSTEEEDTANMRKQRKHWKKLGVEVCQCCRGMGGILRL